MIPSQETRRFIDEDYSLAREADRIRIARHNGCEILSGDDHTLVFDLDSNYARLVFMKRASFLVEKFAMTRLVVSKSKSGNYHAVAELDQRLPALNPVLRLAIQACMGSDWKKEMLGCLRTINYNSSDSKLFRPQPLEVVFEWNRDETERKQTNAPKERLSREAIEALDDDIPF